MLRIITIDREYGNACGMLVPWTPLRKRRDNGVAQRPAD